MAAEFALAIATDTVTNLATDLATTYLGYFFRFGDIVEGFKQRLEGLELRKGRVKNDVDDALRRTEIIEKDVETWLAKAEKELEEAKRLEDEIDCKKCFTWCPNWGWRYCLSMEVAKKANDLSDLLRTSVFPQVGRRGPLQGIEFLLPKEIMASESLISAFNGIMKALKGNGVKMIGLYGMPGVGKTTLVEVVGKQARDDPKLFDKVVIVKGVSQNPNIGKIQQRIAELLGLKFEANFTEEGRAEKLYRRINLEKKILIILDDVWKELELQTIGIPFDKEHEGCKILLTTRLQNVCSQMNCQQTFELKLLSGDEAWLLFKDKAGLDDDSPTLNVAKEVASECDDLPLAIVTVAKALKGKSLNGWILANQRLKDSRHLDNQDVCGGIYSCLKLSYDYLENQNIRSCFLLCSLFPEDSEIQIEILVICGIGQGLFSNVPSFELLRREICEALTNLQQSSLLEIDDGKVIKIHDVVRDFAHWMTSRGETIFLVKDGLRKWPMGESFGHYTAISLLNSKMHNLPDKLKFSKLKILFLTSTDHSFLKVSSMSFEQMKSLQVLLLENVNLSVKALQFLTNLRTLCFIDCKLENTASLGDMKNLEILALYYTKLEELLSNRKGRRMDEIPEEWVGLHKLKSLICFSTKWQFIYFPPNLLSRLASLQELHMASASNADLLELNSLPGLTALTFKICRGQCLPENFVFPKLERYNIAVNERVRELGGLSCRILRITDFYSSFDPFKELFCNVEKLSLKGFSWEHKIIVQNVDQWGLNELTSLELGDCSDLKWLIDTMHEERPTKTFSNLVNLELIRLHCLNNFCRGQSPISFLKKLETLSIEDCGKLRLVFQMNGFVGNGESQTRLISNLRRLNLDSLPALKSIWKESSTHHVSLQNLNNVTVRSCDELKSIFSHRLALSLSYLKELRISKCEKLKQVFAFHSEMVDLEENQPPSLSNLSSLHLELLPKLKWIWKGPTHFVSLQNLKIVEIDKCRKLEYLFSPSLAQSLVSIEELKIGECDELQHIVTELESITHLYSSFLPKLRQIEIWGCPRLEYVFQIPVGEVLPRLESIEIGGCPQLQHVFKVAKENYGVARPIALLRLRVIVLKKLKILCCFCSENFHIALPSLEKLSVEECRVGLTNFAIQKEVLEQAQLKILCLSDLGNTDGSDPINFFVHMFETQAVHFLSRIEELSLEQLHQLQGPIQVASFQCLKLLSLSRCNRLKSLFSPVLARNLLKLTKLTINHCEELEEIIDMDQSSASSSSSRPRLQPITFPSLEYIKIEEGCNLKSLFPISIIRSLPKLKEISIHGASKLERVFGYQGEVDVKDDKKKIVFSYLGELELTELPSLENLTPMGYHFRCPCLNYITVKGCPKLNTKFSIDSGRVVHAITEAPGLDKQDATERSSIAQGIWWAREGETKLPPYEEEL